jgi:hypothetical protein
MNVAATIIKIQPPRVAEAVRHHLKPILRRMITPHAAVDRLRVPDGHVVRE